MKNYILQTENLCKGFKGQQAVDDLSLAIPENAIYGLLGPNGAGKTTTLKMITGIARPSKGTIYYESFASIVLMAIRPGCFHEWWRPAKLVMGVYYKGTP